MSNSTGKSARTTKKVDPKPASVPANSEFLKELWKIVKPNSRKQSPSEDDILEAVGAIAEDNKKAIAAGKEQPKLIKEAEEKAREKQRAIDEKEIEKLKAEYEKKLKALEEKLEKAKSHGDTSDSKPVLNLAEMTEDQKKRVSANGQKLKEVEDDNEKLREEIKYTRAACSFHIT